MSRRRRLMALIFVVVAAAVGLSAWGPWKKPAPPVPIDAPGIDILNPAKLVTIIVVNSAGEPCTLTMTGHYDKAIDRAMFVKLAVGEPQSRHVAGPYVIDAVTVARGAAKHRQELNVTIPGGETRRLTVNADDTVGVAKP